MVIEILDYKPNWSHEFRQIRDRVWPHLSHIAVGFEHVGSTSVPGLAAKPVIDIDVVIPSRAELKQISRCLEAIGYEHRGDLGIVDRDAFRQPPDTVPHHLYVCPSTSIALRNHLALRDHLRAHTRDREAYGALKRSLASACDDMAEYSRRKTEFIVSILQTHGFSPDDIAMIRGANE